MQEQMGSAFSDKRRLPERRLTGFSPGLYDRLDEKQHRLDQDRRHTPERRTTPRVPRRPARMSLHGIHELAREVASWTDAGLEVMGVTGGDGGTDYVEILLAIRGCQFEPCRISIGAARTMSPAQLRDVLAYHLREHLDKQRS